MMMDRWVITSGTIVNRMVILQTYVWVPVKFGSVKLTNEWHGDTKICTNSINIAHVFSYQHEMPLLNSTSSLVLFSADMNTIAWVMKLNVFTARQHSLLCSRCTRYSKSACPSVKMTRAAIMQSSLEDSPWLTSSRKWVQREPIYRKRGRRMREG